MADRRVTDLSYGHLGKASYDTEENEWIFSVDLDNKSYIQQLLPFKEWFAPSTRQIPQSEQIPSLALRSQRKWLAKAHPETFPADKLAADLSCVNLSRDKELPTQVGSLLAIARAVDKDRVSGSRTTQILAVPYGDAGQILRLIRPKWEMRGWGKNSAARLNMLDSDSPDYGHWVGEGGIIRQILTSDTDNGSGTWLAVRQDSATTIFRPQFGRLHDASRMLSGYQEIFPISQLNPNPVATLTIDQTQSRTHADVTFNPWYSRQFAVVDTSGIWSVWDLEVPHYAGMGGTRLLSPGKRGSIFDNYTPDPEQTPEDFAHSDGWYRILWVCNIGTMIVCNRRHIAVINFSSGTSRLQTVDIIPSYSNDWILDIKRSVKSYNHLFLLTTSRIFWIKVVPDEGSTEMSASALKIILSYRHFRHMDDESMKLVVLPDTSISVLIASSSSSLVQFYCFAENPDTDSIPASYQGSFNIRRQEQRDNDENALLDICLLHCPFVLSNSMKSDGGGLQYVDRDVKFFQIWTLDANLGLSSSTFAIHDQSRDSQHDPLSITAPTSRGRHSRRRLGAKVIAESFIVPDGEQDEDDIDQARGNMEDNIQNVLLDEWEDDVRFRIDWRRIYRYTFGLDKSRHTSDDIPSIRSLLAYSSEHIQHGLENNELPTSTLTEISGFEAVSEDTEGASQALREFLQSLEREPNPDSSTNLVMSNLMRCLEDPESRNETEYPDLWNLYDRLADYWMASLPSDLTDVSRVARHRIIQQLAMDVCLSSVCISAENKLVSVELPLHQKETRYTSRTNLDMNSAFSRDSSPLFFSSQPGPMSSQEQRAAFPTPSMTPSEYSNTTSGSEVKEDPAITRLRQYVRSIKSKPDLGEPSILGHWPSQPGANPALYSYQEAQKALLAGESGDESEHRNKKEEARRRRRTERFLRQEQSRAVEKAARSQFLPSGSQPAVSNNLTSSQTVADLPMTQPVLGTFGSRKGEKEKRKNKKRRTAGFR